MDKKVIIAIVIAAVIAVVGGYLYSEHQKEQNSVSISIGDNKISLSAD